MRGIREAAMSPKPKKPTYQPGSFFESDNLYDPYNYSIPKNNPQEPYSYPKPYKDIQIPGTIAITILIDILEVGPIADENDQKYDPNKANDEALKIAEQRLNKILIENYTKEYALESDIYEGFDDYEITFTLTPIKK